MSSFPLFVIAINELAHSLQESLQNQSMQGIRIGPCSLPIHSIMFADDLIVGGDATKQEARQIWQTIQHFYRLSGQTPSWEKSSILFSSHVSNQQKVRINRYFQVAQMGAQTLHLGHPLIMPAKNRSSAYNFVLDKFKAKLSVYKANKLFHAGRLTLIKSVFASIHVYYMSNILLSKKILSKMNLVV